MDPESRDAAPDDAPDSASDSAPTDAPPTLTLQAALKLAGFAGTGGQAKLLVQSGRVRVNGAVETRRKRKLREGDEIDLDGEAFVLELEPEE